MSLALSTLQGLEGTLLIPAGRPEKARKKSEALKRKDLQQAELSGLSAPWAGQLHLLRMGNFQARLVGFFFFLFFSRIISLPLKNKGSLDCE